MNEYLINKIKQSLMRAFHKLDDEGITEERNSWGWFTVAIMSAIGITPEIMDFINGIKIKDIMEWEK